MADFQQAFDLILKNEGGYSFDKDDSGGETYKGIARTRNGKWEGWKTVDLLKQQANFPLNMEANTALQTSVSSFYKSNFWAPIGGDSITHQSVANSIFDFGVNAGVSTSAALAQLVVGVKADGQIGGKSIEAINGYDEELFLASFTIAKISRYVRIVEKIPTNKKFFYGWIRRAIGR